MRKKEFFIIVGIILCICSAFFYKSLFFHLVPFPGDITVSDFQPYRSSSYLGYNPGAIPNKAQYPDVVRQLYPWRTLAIQELKHGRMPLWNPFNFSGSPLLANFQSAVLYPLNIFYFFMPQIWGWSWLVFLQPLLSVIFMYWYCRSIGINIYGSLLAAISYGFSGFMSVWLEYNTIGHVTLWLPLVLLCIEKSKDHIVYPWLLIISLTQYAAVTAGHPQVYVYLLTFSFFYLLYMVKNTKRRLRLLGFIALGIGLSSVQLVPGLELIHYSARSAHEFSNLFSKILIQPWQLIMIIFPNFFGNPATRNYWISDTFIGKVTTIGIVPLFFLPAAIRGKNPLTKWFLKAGVVVLVLITANPVTYFLYKLSIPFVSSSSPTLMSYIFTFCFAVLCGYGLDHWMREKHSIKKLAHRWLSTVALLGTIAIIVQLGKPMFSGHESVAFRSILYASAFSLCTLVIFWAAILKKATMKPSIALLLLVHTVDLCIFFQKFNPFVDTRLVYPSHPIIEMLQISKERYWGYGTASIPANLATQTQIYSPEGYDPLYPKWYGELFYGYKDGTLLNEFSNATRSDAAITSVFGDGGLGNSYKQKILDVLGVTKILDRSENGSTAETIPPGKFEKTDTVDDWNIYTNTTAVPLAYIPPNVETYRNRDEFNKKFFAPDFDPTQTVLLESTSFNDVQEGKAGVATITFYSPTTLQVETKTETPRVLVLSDTYYPGWQASVDHQKTPIFRANWALRSLRIPSGTHTVTLSYEPKSFQIGLYISFMSALLIVLLGIVGTRILS